MHNADLHFVADAAPQMLARCGRNLRYRFVNAAMAAFYRLDREAMNGMPIETVVGDDVFATFLPLINRVLSGECVDGEITLPDESGARTVQVRLVPEIDETGSVSGWTEWVTDITTQRKRERRLQLLWEAAAVLLTADDPDSMLKGLFDKIARQLDVDTYFNFMVDHPDEDMRLMSCAGITPAQSRMIERLQFGQAICGTVALQRQPIIATHIQTSADPKVQLVKSYGIRAYACNPLMADGKLLGTLSFASRTRDTFTEDEIEFFETITRYVTAAYERLQLIQQLQAADRRKDEFLATVSHELRTPLASGYGWIQFLEQVQEPDVVATGMRAIKDSFLAQISLVDDLLDVSRIAAGKLDLRLATIDFSDLVHDACEVVRESAAVKGITLAISLQPRIPVRGDAARLRQVVLNLLTNAVKFTPEGGRVNIDLQQAGKEAQLIVSDTGIGIAADFLPYVFHAFRQGDTSISREFGGLGLGLSIVQSLVEAHRGFVHASSDGVGKGSTFGVHLPAIDDPAALPLKSESAHPQPPMFVIRKQATS